MRREFYLFGIFFLGLYVIAALFQSIIFFQIDTQMYQLQSFTNWFLVLISISLIGSWITLKYYNYMGYRLALTTGAASIITVHFQYIIFYFMLLGLMKGLQGFYIITIVSSLVAGLLYSISLIFSKAGKNHWLRATGIFMFLVGGASIFLLIMLINAGQGQSNSITTQLSQWVAFASSLVPVPIILLFYTELKSLKLHEEVLNQNKSSDLLYVVGGIAAMMIFITGIYLGTQSYLKIQVSAQTKRLAQPFEVRTYVNSEGNTLLYRLLKPQDYKPKQQYPLVVCLHGGAGWGTDNYRQFEGALFARMLSKPKNREKYPAFLFVPQCPPGSSWGGIPNLPTIDSLVFETINSLEKEFAIDRGRIYVTGHSLGGYGTWHFIGTRPNRFAAALPVAGEGNPDFAYNMLDVAVWAFHGVNDKNVPVSGSREMIEAIRKAGGNPRYTESPDGGHSWEIVEEAPELLDWLFAQQRE